MKHIVITGSTRGIGFGLAKRFIEHDCIVTINGTSKESVLKALDILKKNYPNAKVNGYVGNTADYTKMEGLWDYAFKTFGNVDIWINNAGINQQKKNVWDLDVEDYTNVINVNILGVLNGSKIAFTKMKEQGYGQIFNMEGFGSDGMMRNKMTIYGTSKRAVRYFTRSLANEAKNTKVRIGTLSPGMVLTDFLLNSLKDNNEDISHTKKIFNILVDDVDTVTNYLCDEILKNIKNNAHIVWLNNRKIMYRFLTSKLLKRKVID